MPKLTTFITLEESLTAKLVQPYEKYIEKQGRAIANRLLKNDIAGAIELANKIDITKLYKKYDKYLEKMAVMTFLFGSSQLTPLKKTAVYKSGVVPEECKLIIAQLNAMLATLNTLLIKKTLFLIDGYDQSVKELSIAKADKPAMNIKTILPSQLKTAGTNGINIASSLQSSRLAGMGFVYEAEVLQVTTYRISEQLDRRTCPVCQVMHGKEFSVSDARKKLDAAIRTTDPEELKTLSPWPSQTKAGLADLKGMSTEDLVGSGFQTPPYHPRCRGQLVSHSAVEALPFNILDKLIPPIKPATETIIDNVVGMLGSTVPEATALGTTGDTIVESMVEANAAHSFESVLGTAVQEVAIPRRMRIGDLTDEQLGAVDGFIGRASSDNHARIQRGIDLLGLSELEARAVNDYTNTGYRMLNEFVRSPDTIKGNSMRQTMEAYEILLNNAISKMPKYEGTVIREVSSKKSIEEVISRVPVGEVITGDVNGFLSTSYTDINFVNSSQKDRVYMSYKIQSKSGVKLDLISKYDDEEAEVLFGTNASFRVTSAEVETVNDQYRVFVAMEEL
jgi:hypothetical protein